MLQGKDFVILTDDEAMKLLHAFRPRVRVEEGWSMKDLFNLGIGDLIGALERRYYLSEG